MKNLPVFSSSRKVQVFGSSLAMTLPAMFAKANEIVKGSVIKVHYDLNGVLVMSNNDAVKTRECVIKIMRKMNENLLSGIEDKETS